MVWGKHVEVKNTFLQDEKILPTSSLEWTCFGVWSGDPEDPAIEMEISGTHQSLVMTPMRAFLGNRKSSSAYSYQG